MTLFRYALCSIVFLTISLGGNDVTAGVDDKLKAMAWDEVVFRDKRSNSFSAYGVNGLEIVSRNSVSLLQKSLNIDIGTQPMLRWRWRVSEPAPVTDLSAKGEDDRSLAIYVAFPFVEEQATAFERIERKIIEATGGKEAPGRVLMYVWGGDGDRGDLVDNPYFGGSGMMKILRSGKAPANRWLTEAIDIAEDYRRSFGAEAPNPLHIAISADTDDTQSTSRGFVADLEFFGSAKVF